MTDYFDSLRRARRVHRAPEGTRKRRAALTIVHNESVFFPIWLRYYSQFFDPGDIYVLDHNTDDGSTSGGGFIRIPVSHGSVDHTWMVRTIEEQQHRLFDRYDAVLVTDVDEIVAVRPGCGTLGDYIDRVGEGYVNCLGHEIIHLVDREGPFDPSVKVLDQRAYWSPNPVYDKPTLTTQPARWLPGFHRTVDMGLHLDPDLYLIHLHRMDYDICLARHRYRQSRAWNDRDVEEGWASHNRITDEAEFARWFYEDSNLDVFKLAITPIPAAWRGLF